MIKKISTYKKIGGTLRTLLCLCAFLPLCLCAARLTYGSDGQSADFGSYSTPVTSSPIMSMSPTTPVSSMATPFIYSRPSAATGNMIMTGNVGGLQYFHGTLPYSATGNFTGRLESTSLDSFMRLTSPTGQPFYSSTATAPAIMMSQAAASEKVRTQNFTGQSAYTPLSTTDFPAQTPFSSYGTPSSYNQYQTGLLGRVSGYKTPEEQFIPQLQPQTPVQIPSDISQKTLFDILNPSAAKNLSAEQTAQGAKNAPQEKIPGALDQIKAQLNQNSQPEDAKEQADRKLREAIEQQWKDKLKALQPETKPSSEQTKPAAQQGGGAEPKSKTAVPSIRTPQVEKLYEEKANQYLESAYQLLKQQNFYQAADAFTWASLYQPSDPNGYVGKALALFGAGEYVSSSRLLAAGLKLVPDFAKNKFDLAELLGGKEKLDSRIVDLDKFSKDSSSGELYFLLAFVQYKTDQIQQAKASIDAAEIKMPAEDIVKSLKSIINQPPAK